MPPEPKKSSAHRSHARRRQLRAGPVERRMNAVNSEPLAQLGILSEQRSSIEASPPRRLRPPRLGLDAPRACLGLRRLGTAPRPRRGLRDRLRRRSRRAPRPPRARRSGWRCRRRPRSSRARTPRSRAPRSVRACVSSPRPSTLTGRAVCFSRPARDERRRRDLGARRRSARARSRQVDDLVRRAERARSASTSSCAGRAACRAHVQRVLAALEAGAHRCASRSRDFWPFCPRPGGLAGARAPMPRPTRLRVRRASPGAGSGCAVRWLGVVCSWHPGLVLRASST